MLVREFDFDLPPELIAQTPARRRSDARLLHLSRATGRVAHGLIAALPELLQSGDLLVLNNTRVFPARLLGRRVPSGGTVECLLVSRIEAASASSEIWEALMHPGQKLKAAARVVFEGSVTIHGEVLERRFFGRRVIRLRTDDGSSLEQAIDTIGHVPLPPYIKRPDSPDDRDRYQTIFAERRGSIAAPTAGLHISDELLERLRQRNIQTAVITLHVGYGTFRPVRVEQVQDHRLEAERFEIGPDAAWTIDRALSEGRRVVAVGTTTTRTLEAVAQANAGRIVAASGTTDLFIYPGFTFNAIQGLLTNFHLPQSSLLMLVSAFAGRERVLAAYHEAIAERYRFYSYGDAMLIL
jgi:S-adenosylmethionine:tRNA ribosyltransferase-isomerase